MVGSVIEAAACLPVQVRELELEVAELQAAPAPVDPAAAKEAAVAKEQHSAQVGDLKPSAPASLLQQRATFTVHVMDVLIKAACMAPCLAPYTLRSVASSAVQQAVTATIGYVSTSRLTTVPEAAWQAHQAGCITTAHPPPSQHSPTASTRCLFHTHKPADARCPRACPLQVTKLSSENQRLRVQVTELEALATRFQQAGKAEYSAASAAEQELLKANDAHR
jgi:hypothetical protein